jgi:hypothetical protein
VALASLVLVLCCVAGCSNVVLPASVGQQKPSPTSSSPAGEKRTCPQAVVTRPPLGMHVSDRELVPFSATQLGVHTEISEASPRSTARLRRIEVISGGYLDDLTEDYDDLQIVGKRQVGKKRATVMTGRFLRNLVKVAVWREDQATTPCDVHAVVGTNIPAKNFDAVLASVRVKQPSSRLTPQERGRAGDESLEQIQRILPFII